ncbi:MAG: DUF1579 family protein [Ignavibacteriae bacterium]|nr:DUF1579 family protein [Ignavibacteriota bacterium]
MKSFYIIMFAIFPIFAFAQDNSQTTPCSSPESAQMDFWVGEWNASWQDNEGNTKTGTNTISKILGGCALQENFSTSDGSFVGKSFSVYNTRKGYWEQTWVDNSGAFLSFTGGPSGDKVILSREVNTKDGRHIMQRMIFSDIKPDAFTWDWESSTDDGTTWNLNWRINYTRKN